MRAVRITPLGIFATWMIGCTVGCLAGCINESRKIEVHVENKCRRPVTIEARMGPYSRKIDLDENGIWEGWIYRPSGKGKIKIELRERR